MANEEEKPETTFSLAVLATWEQWLCRDGVAYRPHHRDDAAYPFERLQHGVWSCFLSPGFRPWTRVQRRTKPAPATLGDVLACYAGTSYRLRRQGRPLADQLHSGSYLVMLSRDDVEAADWLVSNDGGGTWVSPNGEVEGE